MNLVELGTFYCIFVRTNVSARFHTTRMQELECFLVYTENYSSCVDAVLIEECSARKIK